MSEITAIQMTEILQGPHAESMAPVIDGIRNGSYNNLQVVDTDGTDYVAYTYQSSRLFLYRIFHHGKSGMVKDMFFYNQGSRDRDLQKVIKARAEKLEAMSIRKNHVHSCKVGDIFVASWGYDQTNVDFYEVVGVPTNKSVRVREIMAQKVADSHVIAQPGQFKSPEIFTKRVSPEGVLKFDSYKHAYVWDGTPQYETPANMGH